jgi:hypothetical protein
MINYNWNILNLSCADTPLPNTVITVFGRLEGIDTNTNLSGAVKFEVNLSPPDPNTFITFTDLTSNTVQHWVISSFSNNDITHMQDRIANQIAQAEQIISNNKIAVRPPWIKT